MVWLFSCEILLVHVDDVVVADHCLADFNQFFDGGSELVNVVRGSFDLFLDELFEVLALSWVNSKRPGALSVDDSFFIYADSFSVDSTLGVCWNVIELDEVRVSLDVLWLFLSNLKSSFFVDTFLRLPTDQHAFDVFELTRVIEISELLRVLKIIVHDFLWEFELTLLYFDSLQRKEEETKLLYF